MNQHQHSIYATALLLLLGMTWGMGYTLARFAMTHDVQPLGYAFWQSIGPGIILFTFAMIKQQSWPLKKQHVRFYALCGLLGIAIPNANMFFSAQHIQAGILAVVINTVPIFTLLIAHVFLKEKISSRRWAGIIFAVTGMILLTTTHVAWSNVHWSPWLLTSLISPLCFASTALYIQHKGPSQSTPLASAAGMMIFASLFLTPSVWLSHQFHALWQTPLAQKNLAIITEIALSSIGYLLFFKLIQYAGAVYYSLVGAVVALTGIAWAYFILGEHIKPHALIAIALIVIGIILASWAIDK